MDYLAVDEDGAVVLSYDEFLEVVKCRYKEYMNTNLEKRRDTAIAGLFRERAVKRYR